MDPDLTLPIDRIGRLLKPRYISWLVANVLVFFLISRQSEEVVVEPGQGGYVEIFVWPTLRDGYRLTDTGFGGPTVDFAGLLWNYVVVLLPVYLALTVAANLVYPKTFRAMEVTPIVYRDLWLVSILGGVLTFFLAAIVGYEGTILWLTMGLIIFGTLLGGITARSEDKN
ncbi:MULTISPECIES: hypothetical protein [unclassified Halorhabdus]|uniref:hypothetical protein n=1 Tax=unclassified Halorhabdus TaxID=2621901 RepID=UPI0023DC174B|nr:MULTISPECIES: hypothetical protein [unclassified Halorhabdus]WEL18362.1 hypothetical protein SVXHr_2207 [Halorhabdus sp. SVX81]WEL22248.1 hypothetical protein HBNXHr_2200 [Halorhabdus sp. BNX81]